MDTLYLDISSYCTGYLICRFKKNQKAYVIKVNKMQIPWEQKKKSLNQRIMFFYNRVVKILNKYPNIKRVCWEDQFSGKNPRVGMYLSQVRGALVPLFRERKIKIEDPPINNITVKKHISGKGNSKKEELFKPTMDIIKNNTQYFKDEVIQKIKEIEKQGFCEGKNKKDYNNKNDDMIDVIDLWIYDCQIKESPS